MLGFIYFLRSCQSIFVAGAERLVRHLAAHQIPMALASGSTECEYRQKVDTLHTELFKVFHHRVMSSSDADVKHPKPAPDCFLVAAERFPDKPLPAKVGQKGTDSL